MQLSSSAMFYLAKSSSFFNKEIQKVLEFFCPNINLLIFLVFIFIFSNFQYKKKGGKKKKKTN